MASQFENAGLGMFGGERQLARGGPINDLVKLLPAFGAAYGLVKSGAVDKLNADNWLSNPKKAMSSAIFGSAPPADTGIKGVSLGGIPPIDMQSQTNSSNASFVNPFANLNSKPIVTEDGDTTQESVSKTPTDDVSGATSAPVNLRNLQQSNSDAAHQENLNSVHQVFPTGSPITENPLEKDKAAQAASSDAALARASESSNNLKPVNPAGNPGGGSDIGAQIGLSLLSKFLAL